MTGPSAMAGPGERPGLSKRAGGAAALIAAAALALPGMLPAPARAENAPEHGVIGMKYLSYQDWQPGLKRISVAAPSIYWVAPIRGRWAIEGSAVNDAVSGASPRWHSAVSSASRMSDNRTGVDMKVTRYFDRASFGVAAAYSAEHDYVSRALSVTATLSSEDNNRTWTFGLGAAHDTINPTNLIVSNERKRTIDAMFGVTQVLTPVDIGQLNFTAASGKGYFNDPYKFPDARPDSRDQYAVMARWNHHFVGLDATSRLSYRYYHDSFRVTGHTVTGEWVQQLAGGWQISPLLRIHSQSAAHFYFDPTYDRNLGEPFPPGYTGNGLYSADQRLSAFGARTIGLKIAKSLSDGWTVDFRYDFYVQKSGYRLLGTGSPGIEPFNARIVQVGLSKKL